MPEPGQTPQPTVKRGSGTDQLAYGDAQAANALAMLAPSPPHDNAYEPANPDEAFAYGPTNRPNEPITHGAAFGPGPASVLGSFRTQDDVVNSVADQVSADPNASPLTKAWAARALAGE